MPKNWKSELKTSILTALVPPYGLYYSWKHKTGFFGLGNLLGFARPGLGATSSGGSDSSPTYAWDGIQTMADEGLPIPVNYGKLRLGGNIIAAYATQRFEADASRSYLHVLIALGEGPYNKVAGLGTDTDLADIATIGDKIAIDKNPISNIQGAKVWVRMGNDVQAIVPGFSQLHDVIAVENALLAQNVAFVRSTENADLDALEIEFLHSQFVAFGSRGTKAATGIWEVFYKPYGADDSEYVKHGEHTLTAKTSSAIRTEYQITFPSRGRYTIKVVQKTPNSDTENRSVDTYVDVFDEIRDEGLTYPNIVLVGLEIPATSSVSGSLPDIEVECECLLVNVYSDVETASFEFSQNPIWCMRDAMTHTRYGLGDHINEDVFKLAAAIDEAEYCDAEEASGEGPRFQINMAIDADTKALDALLAMADTCRGMLIWSDGGIRPKIRRVEEPVPVFGMGNILKDTFSESWAPLKDTPNVMEIEYYDEDNEYKRAVAIAENEADFAATGVQRKAGYSLRGVTNSQQAKREAVYRLKKAKYQPRGIAFGVGIDAVDVEAGDVFYFSHDVPQWGFSGRVVDAGEDSTGAGTGWVKLDCSVTIAALPSGQSYTLLVRHRDNSQEQFEVTAAPGVYAAGEEIAISGDFNTTPEAYAVWQLGSNLKKFRATSVNRNQNGEGGVVAEEEIDDVHDTSTIDADVPQYSQLPDPTLPPAHVTDLQAYSEASYYPVIQVSWTPPAPAPGFGIYKDARIYVLESGTSEWKLVGTSDRNYYSIAGLKPATEYHVAVVSESTRGLLPSGAGTPQVILTLQPGLPPNVNGLEIDGQGNDTVFTGRDARFAWKPVVSSTADQPAGNEAYGAGTGASDPFITGYIVSIYTDASYDANPSIPVPVRVEHVKDPFFVYTYEENLEDHRFAATTGARRDVQIRVVAEDIFNQQSAKAAVLSVTNSSPSAPPLASIRMETVYLEGGTFPIHYNFYWAEVADHDLNAYVLRTSNVGDDDGAFEEAVNYREVHLGPASRATGIEPSSFPGPVDYFRLYSRDVYGQMDYYTAFDLNGIPNTNIYIEQ